MTNIALVYTYFNKPTRKVLLGFALNHSFLRMDTQHGLFIRFFKPLKWKTYLIQSAFGLLWQANKISPRNQIGYNDYD